VFKFFLSLRYLRTRLIALISVLAVACAVVIAYVPNPVMEGYLTELKTKVRGTSADVLIESSEPMDTRGVAKKAMDLDERIEAWSPRIEGTVIFSTGDRVDTFDYGRVIGVRPETEARVSDFEDYLERAGTPPDRPFEISPETALEVVRRERAEARLGREIVSAMSGKERRRKLEALGRRLGMIYYADAEALAGTIERYTRKFAGPPWHWPEEKAREKAASLARRKREENAAAIEKALQAREGRRAFVRLEKEDARARVQSVRLPAGYRESEAFLRKLKDLRRRPAVLVGQSMLEHWRDLRIGDEIEILTGNFSGPEERMRAPRGRNLVAVIAGAYDSGFYDVDVRTFYMSLDAAEDFLSEASPVRGVGFKIRDWRRAEEVRDVLREVFRSPGLLVTTWKDRKAVLIQAVQRQKQVLFVILFFADLVAGLGILITLRILVAEKVRDIGILSAVGASPGKIMTTFVITGLVIALAGAVVGVGVGMGIVSLSNEIVAALDWLGFTEFRSYIEEIQHLERIPVEYRPLTLVKILGATLVSALLFSLLPAFLASRLKPVDAIRREFL